MKKLLLSLLCLTSVSIVSAAPALQEPVLQRALTEVQRRIDNKSGTLHLSEDARSLLEKKEASIVSALVAIDLAWKEKDRKEVRIQVGLFRSRLRDAISFLDAARSSAEKPSPIESSPTSPADISYYSDTFEWKHTANGNTFSQTSFSAAHCWTSFDTLMQVFSGEKSVIVKVNDRPNCTQHPDLADLSKSAFSSIGKISSGRLTGSVDLLGSVSKAYVKTYVDMGVFKNLWIELASGIPNSYLKNETLHIRGKELSGKDFVLFYLMAPSGKEISISVKKSSDGSFEQGYPLEETGNYHLVVASGLSFSTDISVDLVVLDDALFAGKKLLPGSEMTPLKTLDMKRIESPHREWFYILSFPTNDFYTVSFTDGKNKKTYRGFWSVTLTHDALQDFTPSGQVEVEVMVQKSSTAFSHDTYTEPQSIFKKTMSLAPGYQTEKNENIRVHEEGGKLFIQGTISPGKDVKGEVIFTLPNGDIETHELTSHVGADGFLNRGIPFEEVIPLKSTGSYMVELNYDSGFPAYNGPVYYGDILPLYKNEYDDIQKAVAEESSHIDAESLASINAVRAKSQKAPLTLDATLSRLANIKALDMATHAYISHTDSLGGKIDETAKRNNIAVTSIGENIAGGNVHYQMLLIGLTRSGGHRANMLSDWSHVGIGYSVKNGQAYYVQVFGE